MTFNEPFMEQRYKIFLAGLRQYMQKKSHLFGEPGIYMSMLNGVAL